MAANGTPITIIGNATSDPTLGYFQDGRAYANIGVAVTPRKFDKNSNQWVDGDTTFYNCKVYGRDAENVANSITRGTRVISQGDVSLRNFQRQDGSAGSSLEVLVNEIGPSLKFATASVQRVTGSGRGNAQPQQNNNQHRQQSNQPQNAGGFPEGEPDPFGADSTAGDPVW